MDCHVAFFSNAAKERILTFRQQSLSNNSYSIICLAGGGGTSRSFITVSSALLDQYPSVLILLVRLVAKGLEIVNPVYPLHRGLKAQDGDACDQALTSRDRGADR